MIEHPLTPFEKTWRREFMLDRKCTGCEEAMLKASDILRRTTLDSILRDTSVSLPDTFRSIIRNRGDWAGAGLR